MTQVKLATDIYFNLNDGNKIPALGLGTYTPDTADKSSVKDWVLTAIRAGYRHIDTAWFYGTEKYVGEAIRELISNNEIKREELFITSKVWPSYHHSPEKSLDESLKDLGLEYVDLLLVHWPICLAGDETGNPPLPKDQNGKLIYDDDPVNGKKYIAFYNSLEDIKSNTKKVKSIGVSNFSIPKLKGLLPNIKKYVPVVNQIEQHPQLPQKNLWDFCADNKIVVEAYSPVGSNGAPVLKLPLVKELAEKYKVSTNEVINGYLIGNGIVSLPRSSNLERIRENVHIPILTNEELSNLYNIGKEHPKRHMNDPWGYGIGFKWWEGDTLSKEFD